MFSKVISSEIEVLKTNEIMKRRKMRLQQVREQSKEIAKRIRLRAKLEKRRQVIDLDARKEKEYLDRQEKLVENLENLYSNRVNFVGSAHRDADNLKDQDCGKAVSSDISKARAKAATIYLRDKKQQELDQKRKLLDRKLQARKTANDFSREKQTKSQVVGNENKTDQVNAVSESTANKDTEAMKDDENLNRQTEKCNRNLISSRNTKGMTSAWEPQIPKLDLFCEDTEHKEAINPQQYSSKKKFDLFALSEDMPSSLRGGIHSTEHNSPPKSTVSVVSQFLHSRNSRISNTNPKITSNKVDKEELHNIKETILRTRASRIGGTGFNNVCHVVDDQLVPVPTWRAEPNCEFCMRNKLRKKEELDRRFICGDTSPDRICCNCSARKQNSDYPLKESSRIPQSRTIKSTKKNLEGKPDTGRSINKLSASGSALSKKNSVMFYNHATKASQDMTVEKEKLVVRDIVDSENAYSQALKETNNNETPVRKEKSIHRKMEKNRNKIAMSKEDVAKEYKDTMSFLHKLSQNNSNGLKDAKQKNINRHKIIKKYDESPNDSDDDIMNVAANSINDAENLLSYYWTSTEKHVNPKRGKSKPKNVVKFNSPPRYHQNKNLKHTPPTKDISESQKSVNSHQRRTSTETMSNDSSISSEHAVPDVQLRHLNRKTAKEAGHAVSLNDKIIIYKILDPVNDNATIKKIKKKSKLTSEIVKSVTSIDEEIRRNLEVPGDHIDAVLFNDKNNKETSSGNVENDSLNKRPLQNINEGVYKTVRGSGDNMQSLHPKDSDNDMITETETCHCGRPQIKRTMKNNKHASPEWDVPGSSTNKERITTTIGNDASQLKCDCTVRHLNIKESIAPCNSPVTSTSSLKSVNDKHPNTVSDDHQRNCKEITEDAGKFHIGATGFSKDYSYDVVIQFKKKNFSKSNSSKLHETHEKISSHSQSNSNIDRETNKLHPFKETDTDNNYIDSVIQTVVENHLMKEVTVVDVQKNLVNKVEEGTNTSNILHIEDKNTQEEALKNNSTIQKPFLVHMSSSSSTAYMSPPEMILPKFLKPNYIMSMDAIHQNQAEDLTAHSKRIYHDVFKNVDYGPPRLRDESVSSSSDRKIHTCKNIHKKKSRSELKHEVRKHPTINRIQIRSKSSPKKSKEDAPKLRKISRNLEYNLKYPKKLSRCEECENEFTCSKTCSNHKPKSERVRLNKLLKSRNCNKQPNDVTNPHPLVLKYVNKLLTLDKKELEMIDNATQYCSSITTPGSSIINMPSNKNIVMKNISLLDLSKDFRKEFISKYCLKYFPEFIYNFDNATENNFYNFCKFIRKKKSVHKHKIKSLNIPRNLFKTSQIGLKMNKSIPLKHTDGHMREHMSRNSKEDIVIKDSQHQLRSKSIPSPRKTRNSQLRRVKTITNIHKNQINSEIHKQPKKPTEDMKKSEKYMSMETVNLNSARKLSKDTKEITNLSTKTTDTIKPSDIFSENVKDLLNTKDVDNNLIKPKKTTEEKKNEKYLPTKTVNLSSARKLSSDTKEATYLNTQTADALKPSDRFSQNVKDLLNTKNVQESATTSTQTRQEFVDNNLIKLAKNKLINMEKIADLTEKCTKRLSNLAKVLEEIRKNKSKGYNPISSGTDTEDNDSDLKILPSKMKSETGKVNPKSCETVRENLENTEKYIVDEMSKEVCDNKPDFVPLLSDIPKPSITSSALETEDNTKIYKPSISTSKIDIPLTPSVTKLRGKPPPALSRINLKNTEDIVIPHELSTVVEIDSPMSNKRRSISPLDGVNISSKHVETPKRLLDYSKNDSNNDYLAKQTNLILNSELTDSSKMQMMGLAEFNEIMIKPFISIEEYAQQFDLPNIEEGSVYDDVKKTPVANEDFNSPQSSGSLPDVISELLKRNIIKEPFKFDTSVENSASVSSGSSLSILALSKIKKANGDQVMKNKYMTSETSDSLSISSNPDLEKAFEKLGIGWASSTLKKTKETLALSSSSTTSNSTVSRKNRLKRLKLLQKTIEESPLVLSDSTLAEISGSLLRSLTNNVVQKKESLDDDLNNIKFSHNVEQQTSSACQASMTVKEFLANELANKITFTNRSHRDQDLEQHFSSLYSTKVPSESLVVPQLTQDKSNDTIGDTNIRQRTSTPVQLFKSIAYKTSSSSNNLSNGLFSNVDELSSVKLTSGSFKEHSNTDKDELTIPNFSLKTKKTDYADNTMDSHTD